MKWLFWLALVIGATAVVAALLVTGSAGSEASKRFPVNPRDLADSAATTFSISLNGSFDDELTSPATGAARYVVLRDEVDQGIPDIEAIRSANPGAEILLYKDAAFTVWNPVSDGLDESGEPVCPFAPYQGGGVDYCAADAHEDWFLHRAGDPSARLRSTGYEFQWAMNPGDANYQRAWIDSVLARLRDADRDGNSDEGPADQFDGVYIDDVNLRPGHGLGSQGIAGMRPADPAFPDGVNPAYRGAMGSFVEKVTDAIEGEGFLTMGNVDADQYDADDRAAALRVASQLDVYLQERFMRLYVEDEAQNVAADFVLGEPGTDSAPDWSDAIGFMEEVQEAGASYAGLAYGRDADVEAQRYVRASFLIGWDGTDGGALTYRSLDETPGGPLGLPDWTASVGYPITEPYAVGTAYRRDFTGGTVVINPARESKIEVELGSQFVQPDGTCTSRIELGPLRALILPACSGG